MEAVQKMKPSQMILFIAVFVVLASNIQKSSPQIIAPSCFSKEDCIKPIKSGYCGIEYDCIAGKCYSYDTICDEVCNDQIDNDKDNLIDCEDNNCWSNPYCHCSLMSYSKCVVGRCWCPENELPHWHISEGNKYCWCDK